jgi:hypothetical protein
MEMKLPPKRICTQCGHEYSCWYQGLKCTAHFSGVECGGEIKPDPQKLKEN